MSTDFPIYYLTLVNKKEARWLREADLGEVQEVGTEFVLTKKRNYIVEILYF